MTDTSISTRVASELLSVHESSIKRWCNAGELDYWTTPGGHRRIPVARLVSFAKDRGLDGELIRFDGSAERVWIGLEEARKNANFAILSKLALEWINLGRIELVERLVLFLMHQHLSLAVVFDKVLADAMGRVGSAYLSKELSIGDEHRLTSLVRDVLLGVRTSVAVNGTENSSETRRTAVVGCIRGEMHEIGALMIRLMLLHSGWNVIYLGQNVPTEEYHGQAIKHKADLICISMSPPRGEPEAVEAINLLGALFGKNSSIRLAFGGTMLRGTVDSENLEAFQDVEFFQKATSFQDWIHEWAA